MSRCQILSVVLFLVVATPNIAAVGAYILAQPLWDSNAEEDGMGKSPCSISRHNTSDGTIINLQSTSVQMCSIHINSSFGYHVEVEVLGSIKSATDELISLIIERVVDGDDRLLDCPSRYVSLIGSGDNGDESCRRYSFIHKSINIHLHGNISIDVKSVPSVANFSHACPELRDNFHLMNHQTGPSEVNQSTQCEWQPKGYKSIVTCDDDAGQQDAGSSVKCRLQFPKNCNATLGHHREVQFQCADVANSGEGVSQRQEEQALILYPNAVVSILDLSDNNIVEFTTDETVPLPQGNPASGIFHGQQALTRLYLNDNKLTTLPHGLFRGLNNLIKLYLYGNQLTTLNAGAFEGLINLQYLYLHDNMLLALPGGIFRSVVSLRVLHLSGNQLVSLNRDIFNGLYRLVSLHLRDNYLARIQEGLFRDLENLAELLLQNNRLVTLKGRPFHGLGQLVYLSFSSNLLTTLPVNVFEGLRNLKTLSVRQNQLSVVNVSTFHGLGKLRYLVISSNYIHSLPVGVFSGLGNLTDLYLAYNPIASLGPDLLSPLTNLRVLLLDYTKLTALPKGVFSGLHQLEYLSMRANQLETLDKDAFKGLFSLRFLNVNRNNLKSLDWESFKDMGSVTFIDLSVNKLNECPSLRYLTHLNFINLRNNTLKGATHDTFANISNNTEVYVNQHEVCECYVPAGINCSAADDRSPYLTCYRLLSDRTLVIVMWILGTNALLGNVFVMIWRQMTVRKVKVQDILLSNLAFSDSLMGVYMLIVACADLYYGDHFPMQSETWRSGISCRTAGALAIASSEASVFFVTLISIDRYIGIRFPLFSNKLGKRSTCLISTFIWVISLGLGIIPSVYSGRNFMFYDNSHVCIGLPLALTKTYSVEKHTTRVQPGQTHFYYDKDVFTTNYTGLANGLYFSTAIFLGLNCICYLLILACYIEIVRIVVKSSKVTGRTRDMSEQIRLTIKVFAIVATDFLCWFPIIILGILVQSRVVSLPPSVFAWCVTFVLPLNSAINPYLYTIADIVSNFRRRKADKDNKTISSTYTDNTGKK